MLRVCIHTKLRLCMVLKFSRFLQKYMYIFNHGNLQLHCVIDIIMKCQSTILFNDHHKIKPG